VDTVAAAPVVTAVVDNVAGGTVGNLADGERTNDNRPTITGNGAEAGAKIEIVLAQGNQGWGGNNLVYTTTAKADGSWSLEIPQALDNGTWYFRAKQTDIAGNTSALGNQKYINISVQTSGFENFDAVQTTQYGKGTVTLASGLKLTLTDNFYPGYGGAIYQNRPGNHVLAPTGNLTMHFDGVNAVSMKLSGANDSIQSSVVKSTYIVYDTAGKVITSGYLPSGDNATFSVNAPSGREIGDIVFNMGRGTGSLQPGGGNTINQDQYFIDDVRWTVNTSSPAAKSMMMSMDDHHDDNASIVTTLNDREINLDNLQHHTINMTDGKQDKLSISLNDVLTHAEKDLFVTDGHKQLMVQGNKGDVLNLNDLLPDNSDPGNWTNAGNVKVSGVEYQVFHMESQDVELLVQTGVTVNVNNH
ncbi:Ig-like domain-containing protein, partial [Enterobacter ludwigii]